MVYLLNIYSVNYTFSEIVSYKINCSCYFDFGKLNSEYHFTLDMKNETPNCFKMRVGAVVLEKLFSILLTILFNILDGIFAD